jgi:hypothetical protein
MLSVSEIIPDRFITEGFSPSEMDMKSSESVLNIKKLYLQNHHHVTLPI